MRQWISGSVMFVLTLPAFSQSSDSSDVRKNWVKDSQVTTIIESRLAFQTEDAKIQKSELIIRPELEIPFSKRLRFVGIGRLYADLTDNLEPGKPHQREISDFSRRVFAGDRFEAELREFYFDWKVKSHYLTIGKQQIVWGKADGLKILDVVNPINMREFLLDDFDNSRIPLWSVKADINLILVKVQFIWIPDLTYHDIPEQAYPFFPKAFFPQPPQQVNLIQHPLDKPGKLSDSDAGVRFSSFLKGWDITVNYLYKYDDFPIALVYPFINGSNQIEIHVRPTYKRFHLTGLTFSNAFKSITLRGELGYYINRNFMTVDNITENGIFVSDQFAGVLGFDYSGISNTTISTQIFTDYIVADMLPIGRQQLEANMTLLFNRNFKNETITTELIAVQNLNAGDGFVRPKIKWQATNNLLLVLYSDVIYGKPGRLFGQFKDLSRLTFMIKFGI